jgi:branched-chain amino acid aminotransferase
MSQLIPYDDRDGQIWLNGELVPWRDAKVHVLTHALHYGSAVFEGERCYDGRIFKSADHSQRLIDSGRILGFEVPYSVAELDAAKAATVAKMGFKDCYVRPIAWRGSEQMGISAQQTRVNVAIAAWDWGSYFDPAARLKGLRITHAKYCRPDPRTAPSKAKATGLYMICTIEKHRAERAGYADALMLDWRGQIAETTGANIFFVKDGAIHTPKADCFLDGITRRTVIGLAKDRGIELFERAIMPEELPGFTQCFITGTAAEVTPVAEIGEARFEVGDIVRALMDDYATMVRPAPKLAAAG